MTTTIAAGYASRESLHRARQAALDKARSLATERGLIPTLTATSFDGQEIHETWIVPSATNESAHYYTVDLNRSLTGIETLCHCPAAEHDRLCWHRAAARLACLGEIPYHNDAHAKIRPRLTCRREE